MFILLRDPDVLESISQRSVVRQQKMKLIKDEIDILKNEENALNLQRERLELEEEITVDEDEDFLEEIETLQIRRDRLVRKSDEIVRKRKELTQRLVKDISDMTDALSQDVDSLVSAKVVGMLASYHQASTDLDKTAKMRINNHNMVGGGYGAPTMKTYTAPTQRSISKFFKVTKKGQEGWREASRQSKSQEPTEAERWHGVEEIDMAD